MFERESLRSNLIRDYGNYLFLLIPPKPLEPGREYEVEFKHEGAVVVDVGNKVYAIGSRANWYPNRGMQFANFDVTFRYPKDLDLVSSGEVVSDATEGDLRITRRKTTAPIRLLGFNLGRTSESKSRAESRRWRFARTRPSSGRCCRRGRRSRRRLP